MLCSTTCDQVRFPLLLVDITIPWTTVREPLPLFLVLQRYERGLYSQSLDFPYSCS